MLKRPVSGHGFVFVVDGDQLHIRRKGSEDTAVVLKLGEDPMSKTILESPQRALLCGFASAIKAISFTVLRWSPDSAPVFCPACDLITDLEEVLPNAAKCTCNDPAPPPRASQPGWSQGQQNIAC